MTQPIAAPAAAKDNGLVRIGGYGPAFAAAPAAAKDKGLVRIGGYARGF
jgi:hypothetical protein